MVKDLKGETWVDSIQNPMYQVSNKNRIARIVRINCDESVRVNLIGTKPGQRCIMIPDYRTGKKKSYYIKTFIYDSLNKGPKREKHHRAEGVGEKVRRLLKTGLSCQEVAERAKCTVSNVYYHKNRI